jgi:hypothetical protein
MRNTPLIPHNAVIVVAKCTILRCLITGVKVIKGASKEPFAATSVRILRISAPYKACDF